MRYSPAFFILCVLASLAAFFAMGAAIGSWLYDLLKERPNNA